MGAEKEAERLDFVSGQVHALIAVMTVMVRLHPEKKALLDLVNGVSFRISATAEAEPATDHFLDGMGDVFARARQAAKAAGGPR